MPSHYGSKFDDALRKLRAANLTDRPVKVRTVPARAILKDHGEATYADYCEGLIRIARRLNIHEAIDALAHEFAHHVDQKPGTTVRDEHRNSWGESYARCYRVVNEA